jgi:aminoglycoside phosphotransferase (APT) family kinase protein
MHADEFQTDFQLVRRLLAGQFPDWATLPIECVHSSGTVNALYRFGHEMVVRLRAPTARRRSSTRTRPPLRGIHLSEHPPGPVLP